MVGSRGEKSGRREKIRCVRVDEGVGCVRERKEWLPPRQERLAAVWCRLFFVHASMSTRVACARGVCVRGCMRVPRCIIVSAGSWLGGPVDISGLRCSCLSGLRTQR